MFHIIQKILLKQEKQKHARHLVFFSSFFALLGAITAFLFSPKSGKENRKAIIEKTKKAYNSVQVASEEATKSAKKAEKDLMEKFNELKAKIEETINTKKEVRLVKEEKEKVEK